MARRKDNPLESDWRIFHERVPQWRERYLSNKNKEILGILTDENRTSTEQFWDTMEKMKQEAKVLTSCLDGHSRSSMESYLLLMYGHGLIGDTDLEQFSDELREHVLLASKVLRK